ncbi:MAG: alpha/beta hydrolase [Chitinophagaceae bacterium]
MKKISTLLFLLFSGFQSFSQNHPVIHLWPGKVPGTSLVKHPPTISGDHQDQVSRLTNITDPTLTVYSPPLSKRNGAAIIICPGGGYQILAINLEGTEIAKWLNSLGYTAFILEYRVPNAQKGALQDLQRAIRLVKDQSKKYHINPSKLGLMGFSAGGSLAARASTEYQINSYSPIDSRDTISSRPAFTLLIYPAYLDLGPHHSLTPELKVNADTPPMFIFAANDDPYGNSTLVMTEAMRMAKASVELHYYPHGGHGYGLRKGNPAAEAWPSLAKKWMTKIIFNR